VVVGLLKVKSDRVYHQKTGDHSAKNKSSLLDRETRNFTKMVFGERGLLLGPGNGRGNLQRAIKRAGSGKEKRERGVKSTDFPNSVKNLRIKERRLHVKSKRTELIERRPKPLTLYAA